MGCGLLTPALDYILSGQAPGLVLLPVGSISEEAAEGKVEEAALSGPGEGEERGGAKE